MGDGFGTDACIAAQFLVLRGFTSSIWSPPSAAARGNFGGIAVWRDLKTLAAKLLVPPLGFLSFAPLPGVNLWDELAPLA